LGIDLQSVGTVVLSHGHYDHTGGLREVLYRTGEVRVVAHPEAFAPKYVRLQETARERYIGVPFCREELESLGANFILSREAWALAEGLWVTGEVEREVAWEPADERLLVRENGLLSRDPLRDDLSLILVTSEGLILVLGCAHAGVVNIVQRAMELTACTRVRALIGGMHLVKAHAEFLEKTAGILEEWGVEQIVAAHCTGWMAGAFLRQRLGDRVRMGEVGQQWQFRV